MEPSSSKKSYLETFDHGPSGWWGFDGNHVGYKALTWEKGSVSTWSPWWIDYNHAPPGAGYLHMLFSLNVRGPFSEAHHEAAGENKFAAQRHPLDFREARIRVRVRGELETRGAELVLLIQGKQEGKISGWLLTGQPIKVTKKWSEQTIVASNDVRQWTCIKARHDRADYYGFHPLESILGNVNVNLMFVLFPLTVRPMGPLKGSPHRQRAGRDYPVWRSSLPEGYVQLDTVQINFA